MVKTMNLQERIDRLFEEVETFPELLEINHDVWERLQEIASTKNYILTDVELRTDDGKTLVTLDTPDNWQQLLVYLDLEDLKDEPLRDLDLSRLGKMKAYPEATMRRIIISATLGDGELPSEDQIKEILTANLAPIKGRIHGKVEVIKQNEAVTVKANILTKDDVEDSEITDLLKTNLDKVMTISNIEVKDIV
jgi:hypothetical protein